MKPSPDQEVPGRVSVVIPAYNCAGTVQAAVTSVLGQDLADLELIVVNDGSTDRTGEVLAEFGDRIRVLTQPNGGLAAARNAGQRAATGEYLAWMDADDLMAPGRLRAQADVLRTHPAIGVVSSDFSAFRGTGEAVASSYIGAYYDALGRVGGLAAVYPERIGSTEVAGRSAEVRAGRIYEHLLWGNFVHPPTVMVRRTVLLEAGYADTGIRYSSDYELLIRLARLARFGYVDAPLLEYRLSPGQMSHLAGNHLMQLETARILEGIRRSDPELARRVDATLRRRIAESLVHAADAVAVKSRRGALRLLLESARHQLLVGASAVVVGRMVIPPALVPALKHLSRAIFRAVIVAGSLGLSEWWEFAAGLALA